MAKLRENVRGKGFYEEIKDKLVIEEDGEEDCLEVPEGEMGEGVYRVERVVERRRAKKGRKECLVLWEGYRREEASWVPERDVTAAALRTYTDPDPPVRVILDAVSTLTTGILNSLKLGVVRGCSFRVSVRRDVFNYLFGGCGYRVYRKRGKLYNRNDFKSEFFRDDDFVFVNSLNECISVDFPVCMYSYVKFVKLNSRTDFCETVCVTLMKKYS